ncbi:PEP-CTERM sorting domain-containing protein [Rhodocyclus tenuis]|uniref:PEP-CTERM sorting domain-containing protein n=1 Tax=Rhodocyclus tenuis TaxID=1066 RepID=UPI0019072C6B|nr:PEP-CTERM sorting domain-containing protein [Rhodocyclus tenuis]
MKLRTSKIFGLVAGLGVLALSSSAMAAEFRLNSQTYSGSYANTQTVVTDAQGQELLNSSGTQWFDSASAYEQSTAAASFSGDFRQYGDPVGTTSANWSGYAQTTYGGNHVAASISGAASTVSNVYSGVDPSSGTTLSVSATPYRYVQAYSSWEELFLITSKYGTGQTGSLTFHVRYDGTLNGDTASSYYNLSYFNGSSVVSKGEYGDVGAFNNDLVGTFTFKYGDPLYLQSELSAYLSDVGVVDVRHSAVITGIDLPEGSAIRFLSGASANTYGTLVGGLYGEYGSGGTLPSVPEPGSYAMLLAGLGLLGAIARRRSGRSV